MLGGLGVPRRNRVIGLPRPVAVRRCVERIALALQSLPGGERTPRLVVARHPLQRAREPREASGRGHTQGKIVVDF
jgi:hypothetical protein